MNVPPKVILVPIDFSDPSRAALDVAAQFAVQFGSELCLLHVVPVIPDLPDTAALLKEGEYEKELHTDAEKRLDDMVEDLEKKKIHATAEVGTANDVPMEIVRYAEDENADLIVIASHGLSGWKRFVLGSVAEKVVHDAPCAVLMLRAKQAEAEHEQVAKA
jgi:nucleotide-binding universal stress UspA family protein